MKKPTFPECRWLHSPYKTSRERGGTILTLDKRTKIESTYWYHHLGPRRRSHRLELRLCLPPYLSLIEQSENGFLTMSARMSGSRGRRGRWLNRLNRCSLSAPRYAGGCTCKVWRQAAKGLNTNAQLLKRCLNPRPNVLDLPEKFDWKDSVPATISVPLVWISFWITE